MMSRSASKYLEDRDDTSKFPHELNMSVVAGTITRNISCSVILVDEVVPPDVHAYQGLEHITRDGLLLNSPRVTIRCASFRYSATSHSIPLLFSTKSSVWPYVRTVSIKLTA